MDKKLKDALAAVVSRETMLTSLGMDPLQAPEPQPGGYTGPTIHIRDWISPEVLEQMVEQPQRVISSWAPSGEPEWMMKVGAGGRSKVTGGTYQERRYVPERDAFDVVTRDVTGAVISTVEEPMKQLHVVKPSTPRVQMAGAEVLDYSDSYMVEGHNPGLLLARYRDVVGSRRKVDTLVGMGISGTVGVVNLARDLGIDYLILRKDGVSSHSSWPAEGRLGRNWLFVDDLVSSGHTFAKVWDKMQNIQKDTGFTSTFRGMFLYASPRGRFVSNRYDKEQFHWWLDGQAEHYQNEFKSKRSTAW